MMFFHGPIQALPLFYLDPGSGSFLIQMLLAAGLGIGVAVKMYWTKIKGFFSGNKSKPDPSSDEADEE